MRRPEIEALLLASGTAGEPALRVPPGPAQDAALEAIRQEILSESPHAHLSKWDKRQGLVASTNLPGVTGYRSYRYTRTLYVFFTGEELQVSDAFRKEGSPLSGAEQLRRLFATLRERMHEQHRREQKRDKIRKLKERSIEAQVDAIAARVGFAYVLRPMQTKVKLVVRLDGQSGLAVDIPYGRIQEVLEGLPALVEKVRDLYGQGVRFKLVSTLYVRDFRDPGRA
jgi:hypothetical protein